ncbi:MAG: TIGR02757 family protein [Spirosomataceae bacterium]
MLDLPTFETVAELLNCSYQQYNQPQFIQDDPICIPHRFSRQQDVEITGFITAVLAWGQRKTIINKSVELFERMDNAPYDFVVNHQENDLKRMLTFKHRTFNTTDLLYFIAFFQWFYSQHNSLEEAFLQGMTPSEPTVEKGLIGFHDLFCSLDVFPSRTRKHIATPQRNSSCKRLNMFLRWMVRQDTQGVDFGIWKQFKPSQLVCPCDVHVERVARKLGLITRPKTDWQTALELTENLKQFDAQDPVKYDFALFGLGVEGTM